MSLKCVAHVPIQHRDSKPAWCHNCGLDKNFETPVSLFERLDNNRKNAMRELIIEAMGGGLVYREAEAHILLNDYIKACGGTA